MNPSPRFVLRDLGLPSRLAIAAFLLSVGLGYFAALVQLHFQHAGPGKLLPDAGDAVYAYHGRQGMSQLECLLIADENKPFNGNGSMRQTFTTKSAGWKNAIRKYAQKNNVSLEVAEANLRKEREGERHAMLDWIRSGAGQASFEGNSHVLASHLANRPITEEFIDRDSDGSTRLKIQTLFESRCARCHGEGASGKANSFPLETWEQIHDYCEMQQENSGGMSLKKLAQSTHVHLLGFSMLYGLTGFLVTLTSYPTWVRCLLGPSALVAQVVDMSFWWLARIDPTFAKAIVFTGGIVAVALSLQLLLSLFNLFGKLGKSALVVLLVGACVGGYVAKERVIDPFLAKEKETFAAQSE